MVNAGEFVGGAVLGAGVGPGGDFLWETVRKSINFKSCRTNLGSRMESLKPLINEIEQQNTKLSVGDEEIKDLKDKIKEGEDLVVDLKKVSAWSLRTPLCTSQVDEFDDSCQRQLEILNVQGIRDVKQTLILSKDHTQQLNDCKSDVEQTLDLAKVHKDQLDDCKRDVKETLDLARNHASLLFDCKGDVEEVSAWTSKTTDQLVEVASDGKETLGLARKMDIAIGRLDLLPLMQNDNVASSAERAALEESVKLLRSAAREAMRILPLAEKGWLFIDEDCTAILEFIARSRLVEEKVWDGIAFDELKGFRKKIDQGVELARKWCNVRVWTSDKEDKYTSKILDLEKSLEALAVRLKIPLDVSIPLARHVIESN